MQRFSVFFKVFGRTDAAIAGGAGSGWVFIRAVLKGFCGRFDRGKGGKKKRYGGYFMKKAKTKY